MNHIIDEYAGVIIGLIVSYSMTVSARPPRALKSSKKRG